jgi:hypothetical protein
MRLSLAILLGVLLSANALAFKADAPIGNAVIFKIRSSATNTCSRLLGECLWN